MSDKTEYFTTGEAAKFLNVSIAAIYRAQERGSLKFYKSLGGNRNLLKLSDIQKYKKNRKVGRPKTKQRKIKF